MSKLKRTLTPTQENAIDDAVNKLHRLAQASDLLSPASYRASQRDVLRRLVTTSTTELFGTAMAVEMAARHHIKNGDMDGDTCLLSVCAMHYPLRKEST